MTIEQIDNLIIEGLDEVSKSLGKLSKVSEGLGELSNEIRKTFTDEEGTLLDVVEWNCENVNGVFEDNRKSFNKIYNEIIENQAKVLDLLEKKKEAIKEIEHYL